MHALKTGNKLVRNLAGEALNIGRAPVIDFSYQNKISQDDFVATLYNSYARGRIQLLTDEPTITAIAKVKLSVRIDASQTNMVMFASIGSSNRFFGTSNNLGALRSEGVASSYNLTTAELITGEWQDLEITLSSWLTGWNNLCFNGYGSYFTLSAAVKNIELLDVGDGVIAFYPCDEYEGLVINDTSGNNRHGAVVNIPEEIFWNRYAKTVQNGTKPNIFIGAEDKQPTTVNNGIFFDGIDDLMYNRLDWHLNTNTGVTIDFDVKLSSLPAWNGSNNSESVIIGRWQTSNTIDREWAVSINQDTVGVYSILFSILDDTNEVHRYDILLDNFSSIYLTENVRCNITLHSDDTNMYVQLNWGNKTVQYIDTKFDTKLTTSVPIEVGNLSNSTYSTALHGSIYYVKVYDYLRLGTYSLGDIIFDGGTADDTSQTGPLIDGGTADNASQTGPLIDGGIALA